ncbi:hypothetical protein [Brevibacterium album]|uniref:hypothetical protein n=1 Tax=Brevibacterium album TaxID=417948 RepID=UPI0012EB4E7E|nr:hypothetical protein [Brevibacterium album]
MAKHFAAASVLIETDPELAHEHSQAAVRRGSRVGAVREAAGIIAYQLDLFDEAARELRTHRRISGSNDNLPLIADAERGRGRPAKALELFEEAEEKELGSDLYTELLMVAAGAHIDQGDIGAARRLLETRPFTGNANGTLVRLLSVYSDVIRLEGDADLADRYEELARRTAKATGTLFGDEEIDPNEGVEIVTLEEIELPEDEEGAESEAEAEPELAADDATGDDTAEAPTATADSVSEEGLTVAETPDDAPADAQEDRPDDAHREQAEEPAADFSAVDAEFDPAIVDELDELLAEEDAEDTEDAHRED